MVKNIVERFRVPYLLDEPGDGGAGGGAGGGGTPGADNNGATKAGEGKVTPDANGNVKPVAGGTKPVEDPRIAGLIADLQKERTARQKFERDHTTTAVELERERKRVRALSGLDNPTKEEQDEQAIRDRINQLYPGLAELTPDDIKALKEANGRLAEMRDATVHTWKAHGQKMLTAVTSGMQKVLGGKLTERQSNRLQQAYVEEARNNPEFLARHEAGDQTLVDEFVKEWQEDFVEPGRRSALASETLATRRPRVPGGKDRSVVGSSDKPIDVKDPKAVEDFLVKSFKERGGQFGAR